jgi:hypothetical protein
LILLRRATDEEKRARDRLAHEAWGQKLSVDEFVAREERLRAHVWARENMSTWLLLDGERILSSCETFDLVSFLDGRRGRSFGVASVYTEPSLRRRRHAAKMMEALVGQVSECQAGILFSDVGDYYAQLGWRMVPAWERVLPPSLRQSSAERLDAVEIDRLWETVAIPRARFIVWPSAAQLDWHRERERIYAERFGRAPLSHAGARTRGGLVAWAADFKNDKLVILHLQADHGDDLLALTAAAQRQAAEAQLRQVVAWDVLAHWPHDLGERRPRADSLPMVLPLVAGSESWSFVPRALWI